jgi:MEDS: MEthanogen/methylotroph, DcmR Sensory domain/STAS domain
MTATLVDRLRPGDHVSWTVDSDASRDAVLADYVRGGVRVNHKVVLLSAAVPPDRSLESLADAGIDVDCLVATGRLEVHDAAAAYLGGGRFEPRELIAASAHACTQARAAGFDGLRLMGDMAWAAAPVVDAEVLDTYEAQANAVYADGFAIGLCLYDRRLFDDERLTSARFAHPAAVTPSSTPDWTPMLRIRSLDDTAGLELAGEADLSNRGSLVAVLDELLDTPPNAEPPVLDVSRLRFADVATARCLVRAAVRVGALRIVGASPHLAGLLRFAGSDRTPQLTVEPAGVTAPARR